MWVHRDTAWAALIALLLVVGCGDSEESASPEEEAETKTPKAPVIPEKQEIAAERFRWLPAESEVLISTDLSALMSSSFVQDIGKKVGLEKAKNWQAFREKLDLGDDETFEELTRVTLGSTSWPAKGFGGIWEKWPELPYEDFQITVVLTKKSPWDLKAIEKKYEAKQHDGKTYYTGVVQAASYFPDETTRVIGPERSIKHIISQDDPTESLVKHFADCRGGHDVVMAFHPSDRKAFEGLSKFLTPLGPGLADGVSRMKSGSVGLDVGDDFEMEVVTYFPGPNISASMFKAVQQSFMNSGRQMAEQQKQLAAMLQQEQDPNRRKAMAEGFASATRVFRSFRFWQVQNGILLAGAITAQDQAVGLQRLVPFYHWVAGEQFLAGFGMEVTEKAQAMAKRIHYQNRLGAIARSWFEHAGTHGVFPLAKDRKDSQLSWRVHVLPFLGQAALFEEFHTDEPWDSPHNKTLIEKMPAVFASPDADAKLGQTPFLSLSGPGGIFENAGGLTGKDIPDGPGNTAILVSVKDDHAVTWTQPSDYEYTLADVKSALAVFDDQLVLAFADGSIRSVPNNVPNEILANLFQIDGVTKAGKIPVAPATAEKPATSPAEESP